MPQPGPDRLAHCLRDTNSRLGFWLDAITVNPAACAPRVISPQQMAALLSELMRAGEWIRSLPKGPRSQTPELEEELTRYRKRVERLRDLLPAIHDALLRERARLEQERTRLESAAQWARRSRETL